LGRSPTTAELAERLDMDEEEGLEGLAAGAAAMRCRWTQPVGNELDGSLGELVVAPAAREEPEDVLALPGLVSTLPELEREVIVLRFFQDLDRTPSRPGSASPQMHVSRLQRRALARMRTQLVEP